jgi:hypothetical protein
VSIRRKLLFHGGGTISLSGEDVDIFDLHDKEAERVLDACKMHP